MKRIFDAGGSAQAHLVCSLLKSCGISAVVRGDVPTEACVGEPPSVWVLDDRLETEAQAIIKREGGLVLEDTGPAGWRCWKCGQEHESQYTACWRCGTERA